MEKMIQREVTYTHVAFAQLTVVEGQPLITRDSKVLVGNVDVEKAHKLLTKEIGSGVTVLSVKADTKRFQMPVSTFIELGEEVKEKTE